MMAGIGLFTITISLIVILICVFLLITRKRTALLCVGIMFFIIPIIPWVEFIIAGFMDPPLGIQFILFSILFFPLGNLAIKKYIKGSPLKTRM
jgi:hypothetical protein